MNCLCCGKPFSDKANAQELNTQWHSSCVKKFFGTRKFPDIDITDEILEKLALESTNKGYTVPGVQKSFLCI